MLSVLQVVPVSIFCGSSIHGAKFFSLYVVGTQMSHLNETVLLSTQNKYVLIDKKIFTILLRFFFVQSFCTC